MQRYKVLHGALALRKFTVAELSDYVGAPQNSVHTILNRDQIFFKRAEKVKTGVRGGQPVTWCVDQDKKAALLKELEDAYPSFIGSADGIYGEDSETQLAPLEYSSLELAENLVEEFLAKVDREEECEEIISLCKNQIDATKILLGQRRLGEEVVSDEFSRRVEAVEQRFDEIISNVNAKNEDHDEDIIDLIESNLVADEVF
ncbi:MAG: hypothetical protein AAF391_11325, partial [Bacteroidota bacterium]